MSNLFQIQITLPATPERLFEAWTSELARGFAEHADVSLGEKRYDFWGRFTPEAPDREKGRHPLLHVDTYHELQYEWHILDQPTQVKMTFVPRGEQTVVSIKQADVPKSHDISSFTFEDFWFLSLENLRRHIDGKRPVLCDFSGPLVGDIHHSVEIDGTREAVWEALIKPEQLERWIASNATVEPIVGGRYDFGWGGVGPVKILELVPNEKLAYSWPEGDTPSVVTWTLEGSGDKTRLTLVHSGFAPDKPTGGINAGWLNFASWVKSIVEYGPNWTPAIIPLSLEVKPFYPKSIWDGQSSMVVERKSLGNYVEILTSVSDLASSKAFYETLGFQEIGDGVFADGAVNIRLSTDSFSSPTLNYMGSDVEAIKAVGIPVDGNGSFTDPNGLRVALTAQTSNVPMPQGEPMQRKPLSRCGKFGEFAISCKDTRASIAFWERLGFTQMHFAEEPSPWAILSDGLIILGLHQTSDFNTPTITYFARDSGKRIEQLQQDSIVMTPIEPAVEGQLVNATFQSPDGQKFFLFQGEI